VATPLRVAVAGVTGRTGRAVAEAILEAEDLRLSGGVSRSQAGRSLAEVLGRAAEGRVFGSVSELLSGAPTDVLVDYTSAEAVGANVRAAVERGVSVVVGSSGLSAEDYGRLDALARDRGVGIVASGNFSVLAALLQRFAAQAAEHVESWEVIDYADAGKPDAPSGTARALAERLAEVHRPRRGRTPGEVLGQPEARGADVAGTQVHSVRLPGYYVSTDVVFAAAGERLVIRHEAGAGAEPYVRGTLAAVRRAPGVTGVLRGLDRLL
jgi:4-hydroxy-tetrahydrodipicolinate reductase